ncbi:hypothetical protein F5Y17DRAFT_461493 [Xylariaceae sp. FL0594]|nr:hypothetical protein F5Y17DRAFT_461493 [Xylariaceae sp. FL0594]
MFHYFLNALFIASLIQGRSAMVWEGPYNLRVIGDKDPSVDGYLSMCHSGAGQFSLCYWDNIDYLHTAAFTFYTVRADWETSPRQLVYWTWPEREPYCLDFFSPFGTNVKPTILDNRGSGIYFHITENKTLSLSGIWDDSHANETNPGIHWDGDGVTKSNFHVCWQYIDQMETYWFYSIAWVTTQPPHNPSCTPATVSLVPHSAPKE